ncbi:DciA family protein [Chitiniphilus purpureus]|uniref:DciA family protein n=1 Tax=Chitiniphilus purpureus TaxID=2981137 RepID=A0ABY6DPM8_9NEIS|nr:DciA family protein [Chitiniphilus sp. CD1]UXY15977.1 DciA family protein [Chitiniphilus sp. CD1]
MAQVEELNRLLATVRGAVPPALGAACIAATVHQEVLQVGVTSPAAAARLKVAGKAVLAAVRLAGWQATAIRPRVQVGLLRQKAMRTKDLTMSPAALAAFDTLAQTLEDGPLREAVQRLARHHR